MRGGAAALPRSGMDGGWSKRGWGWVDCVSPLQLARLSDGGGGGGGLGGLKTKKGRSYLSYFTYIGTYVRTNDGHSEER